jgi:hypothetical protein
LRLGLGEKAAALSCYRRAALHFATRPGQGWHTGHVPADEYLVDPTAVEKAGVGIGGGYGSRGPRPAWASPHTAARGGPFWHGPGSQSDNWLVARFLTLGAFDDAARELARVAAIHRRRARPFVVKVEYDGNGDPLVSPTYHVVRPSGPDARAIEFTLAHADFWARRGRADRARAVLFEAVLQTDFDAPPGAPRAGKALPPGPLPYPVRAEPPFGDEDGRDDLLRHAHAAFWAAGKEGELVAALMKAGASGRALALVRHFQGLRSLPPAPLAEEEKAEDLPTGPSLPPTAARPPEAPLPKGLSSLAEIAQTLRHLESTGRHDELVRLGLSLFEARPPFFPAVVERLLAEEGERGPLRDSRLFDCLLLLLPHVKRPEDRRALRAVASRFGDPAFKNMIARRLDGPRAPRLDFDTGHRVRYRHVTVETMGLPPGARLLARRDALCFSPDGEWVGTSWGLIRYRAKGDRLAVLEVPLGAPVTDICPTPRGLFVATPHELFRVDRPRAKRPALTRLVLPREEEDGQVVAMSLLWWQDRLWVQRRERVLRYDPVRQEVEDLGQVGSAGLFVAGGRLWSAHGPYHPRSGSFVSDWPLSAPSFFDANGREVWAHLYLNGNPDAPGLAVFDLSTGRLRVVPGGLDDHLRRTGQPRESPPPRGEEWPVLAFGRRWWSPGPKDGLHTRRPGSPQDGLPSFLVKATQQEIAPGRFLVGVPEESGRGGLYEVDAERMTWQRRSPDEDELVGAYVSHLLFDEPAGRLYVSTGAGVSILSLPGHRVVGRVTRADGLFQFPGAAVARRGRLLIIREDHFGPTEAHLDLDTGLLRPRLRDGAAGPKRPAAPRAEGQRLPWLGGKVLVDVTRDGKRYLGGERGLLILDGPGAGEKTGWPRVAVRLVKTAAQRWEEEEQRTKAPVARPADLAHWLGHGNPLLRAKAVDEVGQRDEQDRLPFLPVLGRALRDESPKVRAAVARALRGLPGAQVGAWLRELSGDRNEVVAAWAALARVRRGGPVDAQTVFRLRDLEGPSASFPDEERWGALAANLGPKALSMLIHRAWWPHERDEFGLAWDRAWRAALLRHPDSIRELLRVELEGNDPRAHFHQMAVQAAGKAILPLLIEALHGPSPAERTAAARACALLKEPAAVPHLCRALAFPADSTYRQPILDALVELKAASAAPALARLFLIAPHEGLEEGPRRNGVKAPGLLERDAILAAVPRLGPTASAAFLYALAGLPAPGEGAPVTAGLLKAFGEQYEATPRLQVLCWLAALGDGRAAPAFRAALAAPDSVERLDALACLRSVPEGLSLRFAADHLRALRDHPGLARHERARAGALLVRVK